MENNIVERINKAALKFLQPLDTEKMYEAICAEAKKLVNAEYASVYLEHQGKLHVAYTSYKPIYEINPRKNGYTYKTFKTNKSFVLNTKKVSDANREIKNLGINSTLFIPLSYQGKPIGVLALDSLKNEHFTKKELDVLQLFGSMISLAIRNNQLLSETKKAVEARDTFISVASHELRTPLTSINGYIQLLYRKRAKEGNVEAKWISELYHESNRMTKLIKELLEINRIKQGQLQFFLQECRLSTLVNQVIEKFASTDPERTVIFENKVTENESSIFGDCDKLSQVIAALISNAIKFSPPDTEVRIILSSERKHYALQVSDKGEGIKEEDFPHIFKGFYKGSSNKQGMGVGLLLTKNIITFHKGTIEVMSKPGKGTTVKIRLPKVKAAKNGDKNYRKSVRETTFTP